MQKQLTPWNLWLLKTAYWLGYGSIPGIGLLIYFLYQPQLSEGEQVALCFFFYTLHLLLSPYLGNILAKLTGHSQAREHKEVWTRTAGPLLHFPLLVVWEDNHYRDYRKKCVFGLSVIAIGLYLFSHSLSGQGELGVLILPLIMGLDLWFSRRRAPSQMALASCEGVQDSVMVPWEELARVEARLEHDHLGEPELLALDLFDVLGKRRGQIWLRTEFFSRPERASLEHFNEVLRAAFERHEAQGTETH